MKPYQSNYHSYLLRLWQVQGEAGAGWRASLEDVQTGELHGFQNFAALVSYLEELAFINQKDEMALEPQNH